MKSGQKISIKVGDELADFITVKGTFHLQCPNFNPQIQLYFCPSGSTELILVRNDCDSLFGEEHQV